MYWVRYLTGTILAVDSVCSPLFCSVLSPFKTLNLPFSSWGVTDCPSLISWVDIFRVEGNSYGFFFPLPTYFWKKIPKSHDPKSGWHSVVPSGETSIPSIPLLLTPSGAKSN